MTNRYVVGGANHEMNSSFFRNISYHNSKEPMSSGLYPNFNKCLTASLSGISSRCIVCLGFDPRFFKSARHPFDGVSDDFFLFNSRSSRTISTSAHRFTTNAKNQNNAHPFTALPQCLSVLFSNTYSGGSVSIHHR